jgi:pimeloyl-ACP methyl ester carboxylesterase
MRIVIFAILFFIVLFLITIINSWMRLGKLRQTPRFGVRRWIVVNNLELHYVEFGEGPTLILLPDFLHSYRSWNLLLPRLAQNFRCLALEYPGVGASAVAGFPFTIAHQTRMLKNFIDQLAVEKVHLLGHGYGGTLVFHLAERFPSRVDRSVVIEGLLHPAAELPFGAERLLNHLQFPLWGNFFFLLMKTGWLSEYFAKNSVPDRWETMTALERFNFQNDIALSFSQLRRAATLQLLKNWCASEVRQPAEPRLDTPILHLLGKESEAYDTLQPGIGLLKKNRTLTHWVVEDGEHDLHWQFPGWVAQVAGHFLNEEDIFQATESGGIWLVEAQE